MKDTVNGNCLNHSQRASIFQIVCLCYPVKLIRKKWGMNWLRIVYKFKILMKGVLTTLIDTSSWSWFYCMFDKHCQHLHLSMQATYINSYIWISDPSYYMIINIVCAGWLPGCGSRYARQLTGLHWWLTSKTAVCGKEPCENNDNVKSLKVWAHTLL